MDKDGVSNTSLNKNNYGNIHYNSSLNAKTSSQQTGWIGFNKLSEDCPICGGLHKRCRTNGQLVICGEDWQVPGWKNKGQDKAGIGYLYAPDRNQLSEDRKLPQPKPTSKPKSTTRSPKELNDEFHELLKNEPVEDWALADLKKRGIEPTGLLGKSFPKGIVSSEFQQLPGIYWDGMGKPRFNVPKDAYFCPVFDKDGYIVGGQLRLRDNKYNSKYIWLSGGNKGGINHHLDGKTPHTLCRQNNSKQDIFTVNKGKGDKDRKNPIIFSEGCLKAQVINQLSGYPTIGAIGGNFKGNWDDIDKFISEITNGKVKRFTFVIAADADSGVNELVSQKYKELVDYIEKKYNKEVYIIWYGQFTKLHNDFDDEFATGNRDFKLISFKSFERKNRDFKEIADNKVFTPDYRFESRYLPVNDHFWGDNKNPLVEFIGNVKKGIKTLLALRSPMGTGKTEALKKIENEFDIILIGYRNSLLKQTGKRIPAIYHITEIVNKLQISAPGESISLCVDSIWKISPEDVKDKILVFDEFPLVIEHLLTSSTCKGKRMQLMERLRELLWNCAGVIIMSDQLTDREVNLITSLTEFDEVRKVENTYQMPPRSISVYDSEEHFRQILVDCMKSGERALICTDSQMFTEYWDLKIMKARTLVINSRTLYKKEVRAFLESPDECLHLYDYILISPTAESGLSIDTRDYFDHIFVRWTHLGLDACTQMMHRLRDTNCPVHLFAYKAKNQSKYVSDLKFDKLGKMYSLMEEKTKYKARNNDFDVRSALFDSCCEVLDYDTDSPYSQYLDKLDEIRLLEQHNFRELIVHDLKRRGYEVLIPDKVKIDDEAISTYEESAEVVFNRSLSIFNAKDLTEAEYESADKVEAKDEQKLGEMERYRLKQSYPGIDETSEWGIQLVTELLFNDPDAKVKLWRRYLLKNKELNDAIRDGKSINRAIYGCFLADIDMLHSVVSELMKLPFHLFEEGISFTGESPEVLEFIAAARESKLLPKQKKLSNIRYLNNILDLIGLRAGYAGQRSSDKKREYQLRDALSYDKIIGKDNKGNPLTTTIMLEPLLEQCLDIRRDKLLGKYDSAYFEEKNKALVSEEESFEPTKIGSKHKIRQPTLCLSSQPLTG